jgi:D-alanine-D-alanine ligase-like ATP-grasp enzyme
MPKNLFYDYECKYTPGMTDYIMPAEISKEKYVSIAIIEDESDYDAFKNFGIDAWIKMSDISQINNLINLLNKRFLS